MSIALPAPY